MPLDDIPLVDVRVLRQSKRALGGEFDRVFGYFLDDGAKSLAHIERATRTTNTSQIILPAHCIKGEALHFGAHRLAVLASQIEFDARDCVERRIELTSMIVDIARLRPLFDESVAAIKQLVGTGQEKRRAA